MRIRSAIRCCVICGAFASASLLPGEPPAHASIFGEEDVILSGILAQAVSTVSNLVDVLSTVRAQLTAMNTMLAKLDPATFEPVFAIVNSSQLSYDALAGDVASMGYTLQSINNQFHALYEGDYANLALRDRDALYAKWNAEVLAATQVAARAQATLSSLEENTREAAAILGASSATDGQVAQLQAIVQMLGLVTSQNNTLLKELATTGRVLTSSAAVAASEQQLAREKKKRHLAGYTDRGPAVPPITRLP